MIRLLSSYTRSSVHKLVARRVKDIKATKEKGAWCKAEAQERSGAMRGPLVVARQRNQRQLRVRAGSTGPYRVPAPGG